MRLDPVFPWASADVLQSYLQLEICREQVEWARTERRTFLRQRIEARLANLLLQMGDYSGALALIGKLLTEVRRWQLWFMSRAYSRHIAQANVQI